MPENESVKGRGISTNMLVIPFVIILVFLHIVIVLLIRDVNHSENVLFNQMQQCSDFQQDATNIQAGASILSETATSFILQPLTGDDETNVGPLMTYVQELDRDRRGPEMAERFRQKAISAEAQALIDDAAAVTEQMAEIQTHAMSLVRSVYPLPPVPELSSLPEVSLEREELAMPEEARLGLAKSLILDKTYSQLKHTLSQDIENCHRILQEEFERSTAAGGRHISLMRTVIWCVMIATIVLLISIFLVLRKWLIAPLRNSARLIESGQKLEEHGVQELRLVARAYNGLLLRRNRLEAILRSAAETDSLTGLQNRYSMEHSLIDSSPESGSLTVAVFDVNNLKQTNDSGGHKAGDNLLRTAASCILECFGDEITCSCYRIGGDEFTAVAYNCTEEEFKNRIRDFGLCAKREGISVSVGYAYTDHADDNSFQVLMTEADKRMYEQKRAYHEANEAD